MIHRTAREGGGYSFNSYLQLLSSSQKLIHQPGNYFRDLTSAFSQQLDSKQVLLVSKSKSLWYFGSCFKIYGYKQTLVVLLNMTIFLSSVADIFQMVCCQFCSCSHLKFIKFLTSGTLNSGQTFQFLVSLNNNWQNRLNKCCL